MGIDENFKAVLMEALNHWYGHKQLDIDSDPESALNTYIQDNITIFKEIQKGYSFKSLDDLLYETIIIGLADIEKEDEKLEFN